MTKQSLRGYGKEVDIDNDNKVKIGVPMLKFRISDRYFKGSTFYFEKAK
jgi:hypothetical protein